jgi:hypothetical protein
MALNAVLSTDLRPSAPVVQRDLNNEEPSIISGEVSEKNSGISDGETAIVNEKVDRWSKKTLNNSRRDDDDSWSEDKDVRRSKRRRVINYRRLPNCEHPPRPEHLRGFCQLCVPPSKKPKEFVPQTSNGDLSTNRATGRKTGTKCMRPPNCPHPTGSRPEHARGQCIQCYKNELARRRRAQHRREKLERGEIIDRRFKRKNNDASRIYSPPNPNEVVIDIFSVFQEIENERKQKMAMNGQTIEQQNTVTNETKKHKNTEEADMNSQTKENQILGIESTKSPKNMEQELLFSAHNSTDVGTTCDHDAVSSNSIDIFIKFLQLLKTTSPLEQNKGCL